MNKTLTSSEAAEILFVSPETLRRYESQGLIEANRTPGGHRRFDREEVTHLKDRLNKKSFAIRKETDVIYQARREEQTVVLRKLLETLGISSSEKFKTVREATEETSIFADYLFVPITSSEIKTRRMGFLLVSDDWEPIVYYLDDVDYTEPKETLSSTKIKEAIDYSKNNRMADIIDVKTLWSAIKLNRKGTIFVSLIVQIFVFLVVLGMGSAVIADTPNAGVRIGEAVFTGLLAFVLIGFSIWVIFEFKKGISENNQILLYDTNNPERIPWLIKQIRRLPF